MRAGSSNSPSAPIRLTPETFGSVQTKRFVYHLVTANIFILDFASYFVVVAAASKLALLSQCKVSSRENLRAAGASRLWSRFVVLCSPFRFSFSPPKRAPPILPVDSFILSTVAAVFVRAGEAFLSESVG